MSETNEHPVRPVRAPDVQSFPLGDETLLYRPGAEAAHALNTSARAIWQLCDGSRTLQQISCELATRLGVPSEALVSDVAVGIRRLQELELLR